MPHIISWLGDSTSHFFSNRKVAIGYYCLKILHYKEKQLDGHVWLETSVNSLIVLVSARKHVFLCLPPPPNGTVLYHHQKICACGTDYFVAALCLDDISDVVASNGVTCSNGRHSSYVMSKELAHSPCNSWRVSIDYKEREASKFSSSYLS